MVSSARLHSDRYIMLLKCKCAHWQVPHAASPGATVQVFRDGVAEGQYNEILETEIAQMKEVCPPVPAARGSPRDTSAPLPGHPAFRKPATAPGLCDPRHRCGPVQAIRDEVDDFYVGKEEELAALKPLPTAVGARVNTEEGPGDVLPKHCAMSVIICRKRIQSRLMPASGASHGQQLANGNVLPGTVATDGVLSALRQNFLLVSAAGIQGTSKPTEYVCILDEIGFSPESLAMLSFWSCHTYGLCTRCACFAFQHVFSCCLCSSRCVPGANASLLRSHSMR